MLRLVLVFLMAYSMPVILAKCQSDLEPPKVIIDGYTVKENFESKEANLPFGTTLVLVCSVSGVPQGLNPKFTWMCPNGPCDQERFFGRRIAIRNYYMSILAVNITSKRDHGTYTCKVSPEGCKAASDKFELHVTGGKVVHSYGRLILNEGVISDRRQLQPPNIPEGDGRIECRVSSGDAWFSYHGQNNRDVEQTRDSKGSIATAVIKKGALASGNFAIEGGCAGLFHYLFLNNVTIPNDSKWKRPTVTVTQSHDHSSITVKVSELPKGTARVIIGYTRLDLEVPVEGEYVNFRAWQSTTFSSLEPSAKYRITAWGLGGGVDKRRNQSPTVIEVPTLSQGASPPRSLTVTQVCNDEMQLNWIPPKEPNGDISWYVITYTLQDGTERKVKTPYNINHHTLTGMVKGQNYFNISVAAFNGKPGKKAYMPSYVHHPNANLPCVPEKISFWTITPIIINCSAGLLIEWEEPKSTSEIISYDVRIYLKGKDMKGSLNTTKKYQLVQELETSTEYTVTIAAISRGGRADEVLDNVSTLSVLGNFNECPSIPNIVTFNSDSMIVSESETVLRIDVYRYGQLEGLIKLSVKDQNGTAKRFEDYVLQSRYLYFTQMGQIVEKATVVVKIIDDDEKESEESFELILSTENEDNVVFRKKKMTICIVNDDKDKKGK